MRGKNKLILTVFIILFVFVFNMDSVFATKFHKSVSILGLESDTNGDIYKLKCEGISSEIKIIDVNLNNEQASDCEPNHGVLWDAKQSKKVTNTIVDLKKADGQNHYSFWGHSITYGTTDKITLSIENNITKKKCIGIIQINPVYEMGFGSYHESNAGVIFDYKVEAETEKEPLNYRSEVRFDVVAYSWLSGKNEGDYMGYYFHALNGTTEGLAKAYTDYAENPSEENSNKIEEEKTKANVVEGGDETNSKKPIAAATSSASIAAGEGQKLECDESLSNFIKEIWKYFIIFAPILLIVMVTMDFFKALFSSDADLLKKASSNAIKRVVATVILLFLPLVISTILDFFGLELCLWGGK